MQQHTSQAFRSRIHIPLGGDITPEIRSMLRLKRRQLGLTYRAIAELMHVNWSTIRKWEVGPTTKCELIYRAKLEQFINGDFDSYLTSPCFTTLSFLNIPLPNRLKVSFEQIYQGIINQELLISNESCAKFNNLLKNIRRLSEHAIGELAFDSLE